MPRIGSLAWAIPFQFYTPKNLAAATAIEAAELQERFLWKTDAEVDQDLADPAKRASTRNSAGADPASVGTAARDRKSHVH